MPGPPPSSSSNFSRSCSLSARARFGASSEQRPRPATPPPSAPPVPHRGHGPTAQPTLPTVDVVHELAAADLTCPQCGGTLREMAGQTEDAEEITVVERRFVLLKHRRKKYQCACNGCVDTAPGPLRLTSRPDRRGQRYSPSFAVEVAVNKYLDHLPLERQARVMAREGLTIESQTLWDQIEALATVLAPTYDALRQYVLTAPVVGADETWWRLLGGPERTRWWAWGVTRDDAVTYTILASRSQDAARRVLDGYHGIVMADGYGAYDALARAGPGFTLAHCWAHVRRKFVEAEPHYPAPCAEILELIGQLYRVERACPGPTPDASAETRAAVLELRGTLRREQSTTLIEAIRGWAHQQRALPESSLGKAIAYMLGLWPGLIRFLEDARIPLDNNATERGLLQGEPGEGRVCCRPRSSSRGVRRGGLGAGRCVQVAPAAKPRRRHGRDGRPVPRIEDERVGRRVVLRVPEDVPGQGKVAPPPPRARHEEPVRPPRSDARR